MLLFLPVALAGHSQLWGESGELWDPLGRLPDFSYAGYGEGLEPPEVPVITDVRDHGAIGDGLTDDTAAFQTALDFAGTSGGGAVLVPEGVWLITDVLTFQHSGVVLRGEGAEASVLEIPVSLTDVRGAADQWSWNGGFLWVEPPSGPSSLAQVTRAQIRGDRQLSLDAPAEGWVVLRMTDEDEGSLGRHLHNDQEDAGDCSYLVPLVLDWPVWLESDGTLVQPLRTDLRLEWSPQVLALPALTGVGIEQLGLRFPDTEYAGHLDEPGYNGIFMIGGVVDSWVRGVRIENADSGVLTDQLSKRITVQDLTLEGRPGHHGLNIAHTSDGLFTRLDIVADYVHGLTLDHRSNGNVFSHVTATEDDWGLELDHHRDASFENLFTAFEAPTNFWHGGSLCAGLPSGARGTFWNLPGPLYEPYWGHIQANLVGDLAEEELLTTDNEWYEPVEDLRPRNLHTAQRAFRLGLDWEDTGLDEADGSTAASGGTGCGCAGQSSSAAWLFLLWGGWWPGRRRSGETWTANPP